MSVATLPWLRERRRAASAAATACAVLLLAWGLLGPAEVAMAGWLIGLLFWIGIALGAMTLLAVHATTGGEWVEELRPVLVPAAASLPVFAVVALPLLLAPGLLYPWATDPGLAQRPSVAVWYLSPLPFALRSVVALAGWSVFGLLLAHGGARRSGVGAAALIFHTLAMAVIPLDWVLSLDPHFHSTVFGAATGVNQVLAALAWCALLRPEEPGGQGRAGDLARMMIAALLGAIYLGFAQFLVPWYGNLPEKAAWFLPRETAPWVWLEVASLLLATLVPFVALLAARIRRSPRPLAAVGASVLAGTLLHQAWLVGPRVGPLVLLSGVLAVVAIGGAWTALSLRPSAGRLPTGKEARHGLA
ncbi:hypothetical protein [Falsiroseomonas sp. HW251]|uniref:hypothetical protein n=1 Tax=Falsiroseomonas sp. HW251 TaxID=3390998 RepID=UPI003D31F3CE